MVLPILILGTAQVNPEYGATRQPQGAEAESSFSSLLEGAQSLGFDALDTASAYRGAHALIRESAWSGPVHTKIKSLENAVEELAFAKQELGREAIDIVYFHDSSVAIGEPDKTRAVAHKLLENGVKEVGISVYSSDEFEAALRLPEISVVQVPLNPLDQRFAGQRIEQASQLGKKIIARSIFLQGLLLNPSDERPSQTPPELSPFLAGFLTACRDAQVSALYACLDFVFHRPQLYGFIAGLENLDHARDLVSTLAFVKNSEENSLDFTALPVSNELLTDPRQWL